MTDISRTGGKVVGTGTAGSSETTVISFGVFKPVIRSAVGIVRESAGLVINVVEVGAALICESRGPHSTRRASNKVRAFARHGNIIPFPISRKRNGD